jgi:hypothetical protein
MEDIKVMPKPDWVSFDDIHELLAAAHKRNYEKGIVLAYSQMTGEQIKEKLGDEGQCWVAMDGDKLVGTTSVTFFQGKKWWDRGKKVAHGCFTGILSQYQGLGIMEELNQKKYEYIIQHSVDMTEGDTAETNKTVLKVFGKEGFKVVGFFAPQNSYHYSVRLVKWLNGCPYSDEYINRRCKWSERLTKWQYKPGKIERSKITSFLCKSIRKIFSIE